MKCEVCQEKEATVQITKGSGLNLTESYLCESCANQSFKNDYALMDESFDWNQLLNALKLQGAETRQLKRCKTCGSRESDIVNRGQFGCQECYEIFDDRAAYMIQRFQSNRTEHIGRVPKRAEAHLKRKRELERLKEALDTHVERQEFEEAVIIRDKIKALESEEI